MERRSFFGYGGLFPLPCEGISGGLAHCEDGATEIRFLLSQVIQDYTFSHEDNIIAKSNNIKFPLPGLFGKVLFSTTNNAPAV